MYKRFAIMPKRYVDVTQQPRKETPPGRGIYSLAIRATDRRRSPTNPRPIFSNMGYRWVSKFPKFPKPLKRAGKQKNPGSRARLRFYCLIFRVCPLCGALICGI